MKLTADYTIIKRVLDKYFGLMTRLRANSYMTTFIPNEMLDGPRNQANYSIWNPIESTVTLSQLEGLELYLKHPLPDSYKYFLQQRHFIELSLGAYCIGFFRNTPGSLLSIFREEIQSNYQNLLTRKYLPFARFMDFGVVCFDANAVQKDHNYQIVMFSHEDGYEEVEFYAHTFEDMFIEFEENLDLWISNVEKSN